MADINIDTVNLQIKANADSASNSLDKLKNSTDKLGRILNTVSFAGLIAGLKGIGTSIFSAISKTSDYIETVNFFRTSMGNATDQADKFVNSLQQVFGLNPMDTMKYMSTFNTLAQGYGLSADKAAIMSKNLTQLTYDTASYFNLDFNSAFQKITSGFSGETRSLKFLGVALDQNTLQETANKLGITEKVSAMNKAQKSELIYYQIMTSTAKAQGDLARTMLTPQNSLRVLQQEFYQLGMAVGEIFIPALMASLPVVEAVTQLLTEAAQAIAKFFGFDMSKYNANLTGVGNLLQDTSSDLGDVGDGINGIGKDADDTAKKINKMLMPFDELNNINLESATSSASKGKKGKTPTPTGDLPISLPQYDMLTGTTAKNLDAIKQKIKDLLPIIEAVGGAFATWKVASSVLKFLDQIGLIKNLQNALRIAFGVSLMLGGAWLIYQGVKHAITNGFDAQTLMLLIGGTGMTLVGAAITFKSTLPLKIGAELGLVLGGAYLLYQGVKKALNGDFNPMTFVDLIGGGALISAAGALQFKSTLPLKIGMGLTFTIVGLWSEYNSVKKMLTGDVSLGTILQATGNAFLIGIGIFLLTGNIVAGLFGTAAVLAFNLGVQIGISLQSVDWGAIGTAIGGFFSKVGEKISEGFNSFTLLAGIFFNAIGNSIGGFFSGIFNAIGGFFISVGNSIGGFFNNIFSSVGGFFGNIGNSIGGFFNNTFSSVGGFFGNIGNSIGGFFNNIFSSVGGFFGNIGNSIGGFFNNIFSSVGGFFGNIGNSINGAWNGIWDTITSWFSWDTWNRLANDALNGLRDAFSWFHLPDIKLPHIEIDLHHVSGWLGDVLDKFGLDYYPTFSIDWYANGGFPNNGQLFIANEAGPELVGNIGNKTAVANQNQIVDAIESAAYNAMTQALRENKSTQTNKSPIVVNIGNKKMYEGYGNYQDNVNNMYGVSLH